MRAQGLVLSLSCHSSDLLCPVSGGGNAGAAGTRGCVRDFRVSHTGCVTHRCVWGHFSVRSCSCCGFGCLWSRSGSAISFCFLVSLENVLLDVKELQRGLDLTKREYTMHDHNTMLKEFIQNNEGKLKKLQDDAKIAQVIRNSWRLTHGFE